MCVNGKNIAQIQPERGQNIIVFHQKWLVLSHSVLIKIQLVQVSGLHLIPFEDQKVVLPAACLLVFCKVLLGPSFRTSWLCTHVFLKKVLCLRLSNLYFYKSWICIWYLFCFLPKGRIKILWRNCEDRARNLIEVKMTETEHSEWPLDTVFLIDCLIRIPKSQLSWQCLVRW